MYTWVDDSDPAWAHRRDKARAVGGDAPLHPTAASASRFEDHSELKYSLRSLAQFAPWIRHIYLVTDQQVPTWLIDDPVGLTVVDHRELLDAENLPTFNSHAIESALHRIPGLSEHYLYFNDDVLLGKPTVPGDFFTEDGKPRVFPSAKGIDGDLPVLRAAQRNAEVLHDLTGATVTHRYLHTPHPQLVSNCQDLEARIPQELAATRSHRFRDPTDISFASSLALSYAVATGRGVKGAIDYTYIDISEKGGFTGLLKMLAKGPRRVVCMNQVGKARAPMLWLLRLVMNRLWPTPSRFEIQR